MQNILLSVLMERQISIYSKFKYLNLFSNNITFLQINESILNSFEDTFNSIISVFNSFEDKFNWIKDGHNWIEDMSNSNKSICIIQLYLHLFFPCWLKNEYSHDPKYISRNSSKQRLLLFYLFWLLRRQQLLWDIKFISCELIFWKFNVRCYATRIFSFGVKHPATNNLF